MTVRLLLGLQIFEYQHFFRDNNVGFLKTHRGFFFEIIVFENSIAPILVFNFFNSIFHTQRAQRDFFLRESLVRFCCKSIVMHKTLIMHTVGYMDTQ